jgi:hypothetical protein
MYIYIHIYIYIVYMYIYIHIIYIYMNIISRYNHITMGLLGYGGPMTVRWGKKWKKKLLKN